MRLRSNSGILAADAAKNGFELLDWNDDSTQHNGEADKFNKYGEPIHLVPRKQTLKIYDIVN